MCRTFLDVTAQMRNSAHMRQMNEDELLSTAEVAERLNCSVATVNRWAAEGKLTTAAKLPGVRGPRLFHRADIETLAAKAAS